MVKLNRSYGLEKGLNDIFPSPVIASRAPTTSDKNHPLGREWVNSSTDAVWVLTSVASGSATWTAMAAGGADVDTLTGDSGGAISPIGNNITLTGGTNVTTVGAAGAITFNLDDSISLATSVISPLYTVGAGTDLTINAVTGQDIVLVMGDAAGANKVSFQDNTATEVFSIDSNGGIPTIAGNVAIGGTLTVTGLITGNGSATLNSGGAALSLGTDNSGDNVVIGEGNVARAITIGTSAAAHTIALGSASGGAMTWDTAAGISLDAATASNFTCSGGDLTVASGTAGVNITSGEAATSTGITINATAADGGITIDGGTGGILIGVSADCSTLSVGDIAPTASRTTTIGGGTVITAAVTDTIDIGPDGATTNANSIKTVNVNTGGVTLGQVLTNIASGNVTSGTHTTSIATGNRVAGTMALNLMTGTGTKSISVGNADGLTTSSFLGVVNLNASQNNNVNICSGTSTGAVAIGNGLAGAITVDTAAGISLDAATASNLTVTGAADLTINSTAGGVDISSGEAATSTGITITATAADGGITMDAGTGGILIGISADCSTLSVGDIVPTASRTTTIAGGAVATAVTDTIDIGPDGATTNAGAIKTVNVNTGAVDTGQLLTNIASGACTSGTHTTSIASGNRAAGTMTLNCFTGTGTKIANIGNADAGTTLNIDAVTLINDSVNANTSINTGTSTGAITIGNSAAGAIALDTDADFSINADDASTISVTAGTLDIDSSGALSINSSAGAINIGNDDIDQAVNLATDGERAVTVGSVNGAASLTLQSGTTDITVTGTVKEIDAEFLFASGLYVEIDTDPLAMIADGTYGVPAGATGETDYLSFPNGLQMEQFIIGAGQTILAPTMGTNGLAINLDKAVSEGAEYNFDAARTNSKYAFTIGTDAAFFFEVDLYINDMDGAAPYVIGFRKSEANNATFANYTDYACVGMNAATSGTEVVTIDELNGGGQTITNTGQLWGGDGTTNTLTVLVSAAGVVTYQFNGGALGGAGAFTFDNGDVVCPFIRIEHSASATDVAINQTMKIGYQA